MIEGGALRLIQRDLGSQTSNSGVFSNSWNTSLTNPSPVTQMKGVITVNAFEVTSCASSTDVGQVQARLVGGFFNPGVATAGNRVNDVGAVIRLFRNSNSADAANVLRVQGTVFQCTQSDCNTTIQIGSTASLGTVNVGSNVVLQVDWDRANKQFLFSRDKGTPTPVSYAGIDDSADPGAVFKSAGTRTVVANCASGPRAYGFIDARIDNVQVNTTAKP